MAEGRQARPATSATSDPGRRVADRMTKLFRRNVFSIFNLTLVGLASAMLMLDDPWGAFLTIDDDFF